MSACLSSLGMRWKVKGPGGAPVRTTGRHGLYRRCAKASLWTGRSQVRFGGGASTCSSRLGLWRPSRDCKMCVPTTSIPEMGINFTHISGLMHFVLVPLYQVHISITLMLHKQDRLILNNPVEIIRLGECDPVSEASVQSICGLDREAPKRNEHHGRP